LKGFKKNNWSVDKMSYEFEKISTEQFERQFAYGVDVNMNIGEISDNIEDEGKYSVFYISRNTDDVLQAIEDEKEVADCLSLRLFNIEDDVYLAMYK
jgi:hypothetical protein